MLGTTTVGTSPGSLATDTAKEDTSTGQDHTANPTLTEAPATIRAPMPLSIPQPQQLVIPISHMMF